MTGRRLEVESSRPEALFAVVAFGLVSVPFVWFVAQAVMQTARGDANPLLVAALMIPIGIVGLIVWIHFVIAVQTLVMSGPIITIGPEGFCDRRISSEVVPWERFRWSRDRHRVGTNVSQAGRASDEVGFEVDGPYRARVHYRLLALFFRAIRRSGWRLVTSGTGIRVDQLAGAIRPHARRG